MTDARRLLAKAITGSPTQTPTKGTAPLSLTRATIVGVDVEIAGQKVTTIQLAGSSQAVPADVSTGYGAKVGDVVEVLVAPPRLVVLGTTSGQATGTGALIGQTSATTTIFGYNAGGLTAPGQTVADTQFASSILINGGGALLSPPPGDHNIIFQSVRGDAFTPGFVIIDKVGVTEFSNNILIGGCEFGGYTTFRGSPPTVNSTAIGNVLIGEVPFILDVGANSQINYNVLIGNPDPFIDIETTGRPGIPSVAPQNTEVSWNTLLGFDPFLEVADVTVDCTMNFNFLSGFDPFIELGWQVHNGQVNDNIIMGEDPFIEMSVNPIPFDPLGSNTPLQDSQVNGNILLGLDPFIECQASRTQVNYNTLLGFDAFIDVYGVSGTDFATINDNTVIGDDTHIAIGSFRLDAHDSVILTGAVINENALFGQESLISFFRSSGAGATNFTNLTVTNNCILGEGSIGQGVITGGTNSTSLANCAVNNCTLIGGGAPAFLAWQSGPGPAISVNDPGSSVQRCTLMGSDARLYASGGTTVADTIVLGGAMGVALGANSSTPFPGWAGGVGTIIYLPPCLTAPAHPTSDYFIYVDPNTHRLMAKGPTTTTVLANP